MEKAKLRKMLREREKKIENAKYTSSGQEQIYIAVTRFNDKTFQENRSYCEKHSLKGCLYGSPTELSQSIPIKACVYVLEMNNSTNEIVGIGKIINTFQCDIHRIHAYKLYGDPNYSRYVYYGSRRLDKTVFPEPLKKVIWFLECLLFYGYGPLDKPTRGMHLKRGMGINRIPIRLLKKYHNKMLHLDSQIRYYFENNQCIT